VNQAPIATPQPTLPAEAAPSLPTITDLARKACRACRRAGSCVGAIGLSVAAPFRGAATHCEHHPSGRAPCLLSVHWGCRHQHHHPAGPNRWAARVLPKRRAGLRSDRGPWMSPQPKKRASGLDVRCLHRGFRM